MPTIINIIIIVVFVAAMITILFPLCFQVTDTNDNPPVFSIGAYSFDVAENTGRGARVGSVTARDMDQGVNGQVSYSVISDWANDVFSLNPQSGVFTLTARLDYEEVSVEWSVTFLTVKTFFFFFKIPETCK
jgi:hypothetical protein